MGTYKTNNLEIEGGKREEILDAAAKLFKKKGYIGTSIRDITSAVGILRGSIYSHFESKEQIFLKILHRGVDSLLNGAEDIIAKQLSPIDTLRDLIQNHLMHIMENNNSLVIFMQDGENIQAEQITHYMEKRDRYENILRNVLEEGIKEGVFPELNIRFTGFALLGMCNWVIHWFDPKGPNSPEEISKYMSSLICDQFLVNHS
ncbi:MAG: TetR/AcrR family transcriptional regulator [Bacillota bacterium]|nr:TetR/AcrR family transcriptional regulator [Bacillota bacterium]